MAKKKKAKKERREDKVGLLVGAGLFLGLGIGGGVYGNWAAGVLIGLGAGLLAMALVKFFTEK